MIKANFTRCEYDGCVYFKQYDYPTYLLYVDDMLITTKNKVHIQKIKAKLKMEFDMDLGEAKKILAMDIHSRQTCKKTLVISCELCSQGVETVQH